MVKANIWTIVLGLINVICGICHVLFEYFLYFNVSPYREFLLIENVLVGFVFSYFGISLLIGSQQGKYHVLKMNILFWPIFLSAVFALQPEVTTLNMIKDFLPVSQKNILMVTGLAALILSIVSFTKNKDYKRQSLQMKGF